MNRGKSYKTYKEAQKAAIERGFLNWAVAKSVKNGRYYIYYREFDECSARLSKNEFSIKPYIRAAKQLCYPEDVIIKLKNAKTDIEAGNIMATARHNM